MANSKADAHFDNDPETDFTERVQLDQQELIFDARFQRFHQMLHFIACRVLGGPERAEEAIGRCWRIASLHPRRFEHEGEFRRWLLRVLIDEALVLLRESVPRPAANVLCETIPAQVFRRNYLSHGKGDVRTGDQHRCSQDFSAALESRDKSVISMKGQISNE